VHFRYRPLLWFLTKYANRFWQQRDFVSAPLALDHGTTRRKRLLVFHVSYKKLAQITRNSNMPEKEQEKVRKAWLSFFKFPGTVGDLCGISSGTLHN
jgi:hypothetical protein